MSDIVSEYYERAWGDAGHKVLAKLARTYNATVTASDLGKLVQDETGLRTNIASRHWINRVLLLTILQCRDNTEPPLTSLVTDRSGRVGAAYDAVFQIVGLPVPTSEEEREAHAAEMRLECYRWAGAELPPDGGRPTLSPARAPARRTPPAAPRARKPEPVAAPLCPNCFMELPRTGVCDNCA